MPTNQRFEKSVECPTNESLLAFLQAERKEVAAENTAMVEHLLGCEFCELSVELLRAHTNESASEALSIPPVPEQLQHLFPLRRVHK